MPTVVPGRILVNVAACGVCHVDLHAINGDWPVKATLPLIPGYEGVGTVFAVGAGVQHVKEGDRVGIPGYLRPAATAPTACRGGKRCAKRNKTRAIRYPVVLLSTCWPTPIMWGHCPTACRFMRNAVTYRVAAG